MNAPSPSFSDDAAAILAWWRGAGVDMQFSDDATDWLKTEQEPDSGSGKSEESAGVQSRRSTAKTKPNDPEDSEQVRPNLIGDNPPGDLAAFHRWWMSEPGLDAIGPNGRISPKGPENAKLMVLVAEPEEQDSAELLSGPQGRLLTNILGRLGLDPLDVYFASALTRSTPMADMAALANSGLREVTDLHLKLARPQKIIAFGPNILPFLGHEATQAPFSLREINQNGSSVPLLVSEGLESLMTRPKLKSRFWRRWIEWSANR
ncbi:MAG: hypothetical protein ABJP48_01345 [Erythrobacter sp.]